MIGTLCGWVSAEGLGPPGLGPGLGLGPGPGLGPGLSLGPGLGPCLGPGLSLGRVWVRVWVRVRILVWVQVWVRVGLTSSSASSTVRPASCESTAPMNFSTLHHAREKVARVIRGGVKNGKWTSRPKFAQDSNRKTVEKKWGRSLTAINWFLVGLIEGLHFQNPTHRRGLIVRCNPLCAALCWS
jgi:hypothetical protein